VQQRGCQKEKMSIDKHQCYLKKCKIVARSTTLKLASKYAWLITNKVCFWSIEGIKKQQIPKMTPLKKSSNLVVGGLESGSGKSAPKMTEKQVDRLQESITTRNLNRV
jgi:hypothetical protein